MLFVRFFQSRVVEKRCSRFPSPTRREMLLGQWKWIFPGETTSREQWRVLSYYSLCRLYCYHQYRLGLTNKSSTYLFYAIFWTNFFAPFRKQNVVRKQNKTAIEGAVESSLQKSNVAYFSPYMNIATRMRSWNIDEWEIFEKRTCTHCH